jgi:CheY-like chemotaxis protein
MNIENLIGHLGKVLIVDQQQSDMTLAKNYLKQQNQFDVETFTDGEEAWKRLTSRSFDFVIMGWRLQGMSGVAFLNRIRRNPETSMLPVLVTSGMVDRNDFRLLEEFPCTRLLESPFTRMQFERALANLIREKLWYRSNQEVLTNLLSQKKQNPATIEAGVKKVLAAAPNPAPLVVMAARTAMSVNDIALARKILGALLQKDPMNLPAISEMAKIHCHDREYLPALDLLRNAMNVSPENMQRICLIGQVSLSLHDPDGARRHFQKALEIDGEDRQARAGLTISENMTNFPAAATGTGMTESFASLLNTIGIALIRNGSFAKGIEQYQAALMFLQDNLDIAKVSFNLGLGFLRWKKPGEALQWFEQSMRHSGGQFGKSGNYVRMLNASLTKKSEARSRRSARQKPVQSGNKITYSATDIAIQNSRLTPVEPAAPVVFKDDDLEERISPQKVSSIISVSAEQMLKNSLSEIEGMEDVDLEEIA